MKNIIRKISLIAVVLPILIMNLVPISVLGSDDNQKNNLQYIELYAQVVGVSVAEASYRYDLQQEAGNLNAELTDKEAETFAGLWIEHTPTFKVITQFTFDANKHIEPYLKGNLASVVELRTAKYSYEELRNEQDMIISALNNLGVKYQSSLNVKQNCIDIEVEDSTLIDEAVSANKLKLSDKIQVKLVDSMPIALTDMFGGLTLLNGFLPSGTTGFGVMDGVGNRLITTAAHCPDYACYYCPLPVTLPFVNQSYGGSYDIQWHEPSILIVTNEILIDPSGTRLSIQGYTYRANQAVGTLVFKYGQNTHFTYGLIDSNNVTAVTVPNSNATFVKVTRFPGGPAIADSGDSGGPCCYGNIAYGTTIEAPPVDADFFVYMPVDYIFGAGLTILTS